MTRNDILEKLHKYVNDPIGDHSKRLIKQRAGIPLSAKLSMRIDWDDRSLHVDELNSVLAKEWNHPRIACYFYHNDQFVSVQGVRYSYLVNDPHEAFEIMTGYKYDPREPSKTTQPSMT